MSARGNNTRLTGIEDVVVRREFVEQAERALLTRRNQLGVDPERTHRIRGGLPDAGDLHAGERPRVESELVELLHTRAHRVRGR